MSQRPAADAAAARNVESTYKSRDVESYLDIYFYRPIGYALARFFQQLRFTPSMVSFTGALVGITAGHFYYYSDLRLNLIGMALHVFTNALDNADGQLARLTSGGSLLGAIADGFADYAVFLSVYVHLALRHVAEGGSSWIWLLALAAGASHALQSLTIDHFRNAYLQFVLGRRNADANSSATVRAAYDATSWSTPFKKLALRNYLGYATQQEALAPNLLQLRLATRDEIPQWLSAAFREQCLPLVKWCNCLATNPRMVLLFAFLLLGQPVWYFVAEVTLLNAIFIFVLVRHDRVFRSFVRQLREAR